MAKSRKPFRLADFSTGWWKLDGFNGLSDRELPLALNYEYARSCRSFIQPMIWARCGLKVQLLPVHHFFIEHLPEIVEKAYLEIDPNRRLQLAEQLGFADNSRSAFLPPPVVRLQPADILAWLCEGEHPLGLDKNKRNFLHLYVDWQHVDEKEIQKQVALQVASFLKERKEESERADLDLLVHGGHFKDLAGFASAIKNGNRSIDELIRNNIPTTDRRYLDSWRENAPVPEELARSLVQAVNSSIASDKPLPIGGNSLEPQLSGYTRALLKKRGELDRFDCLRLNRLIWEDVYTDVIHRREDRLGLQPRDRRGRNMNRRDIHAALKQLGALRLLCEAGYCETELIRAYEEERNCDVQPYYDLTSGKWTRPAEKARERLNMLWEQWCTHVAPFAFFPTLDSEDYRHAPAGVLPVLNLHLIALLDSSEAGIVRHGELKHLSQCARWIESVRQLEHDIEGWFPADQLSLELLEDDECIALLRSPPTDRKGHLSFLEKVAIKVERLGGEFEHSMEANGEPADARDETNRQHPHPPIPRRTDIGHLREKVRELASFIAESIARVEEELQKTG